MKLPETSDPEKKKLLEASNRHKSALEEEVKSISHTAEKAITNALFIGGALALTYLVVSQIAGSKSLKKKKQKQKEEGGNELDEMKESSPPSFLSHVGEIIITQATMAILEMAKERLSTYLESRKNTDDNS